MCGGGSRRSLVEGVVATQCGSHVYVSHLSDGITYRDCISHDTVEIPYWWDTDPAPGATGNPPSNDIHYERCIASLVHQGDPDFQLTGFLMAAGARNTAEACVAVGCEDTTEGSGYLWSTRSAGRWTFVDNVAHSNGRNGIRVWVNSRSGQVVDGFVAYGNDGFGVQHGAYRNDYRYTDCVLYGNGSGAMQVKAASKSSAPLEFTNVVFDAADRSDYAAVVPAHVQPTDTPTRFTGCTFRGGSKSGVGFDKTKAPHMVDLVDCTYDGDELWLEDGVDAASAIRLQDKAHGSLAVYPKGHAGEPRPQWNAAVETIPRFR
jgi:hypothetical protein